MIHQQLEIRLFLLPTSFIGVRHPPALGAFGLDEDTIRTKAIAVGQELAKSASPEKEEEDGSDQNY